MSQLIEGSFVEKESRSHRRKWLGLTKRLQRQQLPAMRASQNHGSESMDLEVSTCRRTNLFEHRQKALLISARNSHIAAGLQAAYASKVPGGKLDVFCVSSKLYDKFSGSADSDLLRVSGISELRRFCHSITAAARLLHAQNFHGSKLPSLMNSIELWTNKRTKEKVLRNPGVIEQARSDMASTVYILFTRMLQLTDGHAKIEREMADAEDALHDTFEENIFNYLG